MGIYDSPFYLAITHVLIEPDYSDRIWVTFSGYSQNEKILYSEDGGATWSNVSAGIPNVPVNCIEYQHDGAILYVGTDVGVYYKSPLMETWKRLGGDLPITEILELEINYKSRTLVAGTRGRGLWQSKLFGVKGHFPPTNLAAELTDNEVNLTWESPIYGEITNFRIYQNNEFVAETTELAISITDLEYQVAYDFYITSYFDGNIDSESLASNTVNVLPVGNFNLPYMNKFTNGFNLGWCISDAPESAWYEEFGSYSLDGTAYVLVKGNLLGTIAGTKDLFTPTFSTEGLEYVALVFDQRYRTSESETVTVEVNTGTGWSSVYSNAISIGEWGAADKVSVDLTNMIDANLQIKFSFSGSNTGSSIWAIDNFAIHTNSENQTPRISQIPDQYIIRGEEFSKIPLDIYIDDDRTSDNNIEWSISENENILVSIARNIVSVKVTDSQWEGIETLVFTAKDEGGLSASVNVTFTIKRPLQNIELANFDFRVFPNPNTGSFVLNRSKNAAFSSSVNIYNTLGHRILTEEWGRGAVHKNIHIKNEPGLYIVVVGNGYANTVHKILITN